MTLSEKSAVLSGTRFRYRVAAAADTCSAALGLLSDSALDIVVRMHAAFKHQPRRRRPRAGVDPCRLDVVTQLSLCCCCGFTFQLLKRSGDGLRLSDAIGLSFLILYQRDINEAVTNNRKDSGNLVKGFQGQWFYTAAAVGL